MFRSGFLSQSGGSLLGRPEGFCDGVMFPLDVDDEPCDLLLDEEDNISSFEESPSFSEVVLEPVEAKCRLNRAEEEGIRYCHPILTSRRL